MSRDTEPRVVVRGTEIDPNDTRQRYREKIARITLDSMAQFVLREIPGLADIHLIAVTGYGQESDRRRTQAAGFHHHLVKPVDIGTLEATLMARGTRDVE